MPPNSTIRAFVKGLRTGETNITRSLEHFVNDSMKREQYAEFADTPNALDGEFAGWLRTELVQAGMTQEEIEHIEAWPDSQKEVARAQASAAIKDGRPLRFGWELFAGRHQNSDVRRDADQEMRIVFQSPRDGLRLTLYSLGKVHIKA